MNAKWQTKSDRTEQLHALSGEAILSLQRMREEEEGRRKEGRKGGEDRK